MTPETFHLFHQLPREIRLIIWTLALPRPRIVPLFHRKIKHLIRQKCPFRYFSPKGAKTNQRHIHCTFKSALPAPVIFFVNRESSAVALRWYTRAFPCSDVIGACNGCYNSGPPRTYFDFENDTLFLSDSFTFCRDGYGPCRVDQRLTEFGWFGEKDIKKVKNLALAIHINPKCYSFPPGTRPLEKVLAHILSYFPSVKSLVLIKDTIGCSPDDKCELQPLELLSDEDGLELHKQVGLKDVDRKRINKTNPWRDLDLGLLANLVQSMHLSFSGWKVPKIEQRYLITAQVKRDLRQKGVTSS
jgi:hypothetical protein